LESVCVGNGTGGSNPPLSAIHLRDPNAQVQVRIARNDWGGEVPAGKPGDGFGPLRWIGFEPGQAGNGAALRITIHARGARALRRACLFGFVWREGWNGHPDWFRR
jgi:hypothetical protein